MPRFLSKVILTIAIAAVAPWSAADAEIHTVTVGNNFFSPLKTTIDPGDIVRWVWVGGVPHNVTSDAGSPKSFASLTTSAAEFTFEVQFSLLDGPGPFPYLCTVHPFTMKDTIFVNSPQSCCTDRVGDANGSGEDEPTIGDVSIMIDVKFISGNASLISCLGEADVNLSGGSAPTIDDITIGDVSLLIDYLFITGPTLGLGDCL